VRDLLAKAGGNVKQITTHDGTVLTTPFSFGDLYHRHADSWRVPARESLLVDASDPKDEKDSIMIPCGNVRQIDALPLRIL
jgi:hypothetical protein